MSGQVIQQLAVATTDVENFAFQMLRDPGKPCMLLCDEPTGNLDHHSAGTVASLLLDLHCDQQTILIVVTHSAELAARFPKRFEMWEQRLLPTDPGSK